MEPVDDVPKGYRFLPTAEELVDYLANWVAGTPLPGRAVEFADVYGTEPWNLLVSDRQEGYFFTERKPKNGSGSRMDRKAGKGSWILYKKEKPVVSIVGGRIVVAQKSCLSFKKGQGQRKNSGWTMYEYAICSSDFQKQILCHVKKSSHNSSIKTVGDESTLRPPTAMVQNPSLASGIASPKSNLSFVDSPESNEATSAKIPASSSSVDHGDEQMYSPIHHLIKSLRESMTDDDNPESLASLIDVLSHRH